MRKSFASWTCALAGALLLAAFVSPAPGRGPTTLSLTSRVVLVPVDDRPATTQFTEMIGRIVDAEVMMPPRAMLGVFTTGGDPEQIIEWLRGLDYNHVDAVIISSDMLAYGGLMTSRAPATPLDRARRRLEVIKGLRRAHPRLPIYAFSVVQRIALSATAANRSYRDPLARWAVLADQIEHEGNIKLRSEFERLQRELPAAIIQAYLATRARNLQINYAMLDLAKQGVVNELLLLQDDASPYGLHRRDQAALRERTRRLGLSDDQVKLYDGADEGSSVLLSRAILQKYRFVPRINVVYSSAAGRKAIAGAEDHPLEVSVGRQTSGSGARLTDDASAADYTLYVNAPEQTDADFKSFLARLISDLRKGKFIALADVLFPDHTGGSDPRLIEILGRERLLDRVIGYASWTTPGNTLGTVVPQANMCILARRKLFTDSQRAARIEAAQVTFLLHRYIGDYGYHVIVRPEVNKYARQQLKIDVEELDQQTYTLLNKMVVERMTVIAKRLFEENFKNRIYSMGRGEDSSQGIVAREMRNLEVRLPWVRTFEVRVDYDLKWTLSKQRTASGA